MASCHLLIKNCSNHTLFMSFLTHCASRTHGQGRRRRQTYCFFALNLCSINQLALFYTTMCLFCSRKHLVILPSRLCLRWAENRHSFHTTNLVFVCVESNGRKNNYCNEYKRGSGHFFLNKQ